MCHVTGAGSDFRGYAASPHAVSHQNEVASYQHFSAAPLHPQAQSVHSSIAFSGDPHLSSSTGYRFVDATFFNGNTINRLPASAMSHPNSAMSSDDIRSKTYGKHVSVVHAGVACPDHLQHGGEASVSVLHLKPCFVVYHTSKPIGLVGV